MKEQRKAMSMYEGMPVKSSPDIDDRTGQPIEEAEDNLSRHSTVDSSPPVEQQERTSVGEDPERPGGSSSGSS